LYGFVTAAVVRLTNDVNEETNSKSVFLPRATVATTVRSEWLFGKFCGGPIPYQILCFDMIGIPLTERLENALL
jgi:hypothetical protein